MKDSNPLDLSTEAQFQKARRRAFWNRILHVLQGRSPHLLSFDEVQDKLHMSSQSYIGVMSVEVDRIVGSVGRYQDFDRAFMPLQDHTSHRWKEIARAYQEERPLPPVKLYKVGDAYFVRDGHHRVSVARELGVEYIDAEVIECRTRVPISPNMTERDLDLKAEYAEFLEATNLDRLRPEQEIEFTISGAYQVLLEHLAVHRYFLGLEREEAVSWQEAVRSWYDNVYQPIVDVIRQQGILAEFPGRKEADLYLWIIDHHYYLRQGDRPDERPEDPEADFAQAAESFAEEYGQHPVKRLWRSARHLLEDIIDEPLLTADTESEVSAPDVSPGQENDE
jgi:hypothetical protein